MLFAALPQVKNVSGRLLVGLRYWNEVTDEGTDNWRFESLEQVSAGPPHGWRAIKFAASYYRYLLCLHSHPFKSLALSLQGQREINKKDKFIFWWSLYLTVGVGLHAPCVYLSVAFRGEPGRCIC